MNTRDTSMLYLAALSIVLSACTRENIFHDLDGGTDAVPGGEGAAGAILSFYIKGDRTPRSFSDGLSGQTPRTYSMGLGRLELLRSAKDPSPVLVFDHGSKPVEVDMLSTTLAGQARVADITPGTFTHGRVLLTMASFTIAATVHLAGVSIAGDGEVVAALSDTVIQGKPFKKGQAVYSFTVSGITKTIDGVAPPFFSTGGGTVVAEGSRTYLVFPLPAPLTLTAQTGGRSYAVVYQVYEAFRWQDETRPGYKPRVFDVDPLGMSFEPVKNFGATGFSVEIM